MLLLNSSCCLFSNLQTEHICFSGQRKESTDIDIYRKTQFWRPAFMFGSTAGTAVCQSRGHCIYKVINLCMTFFYIQVLRIFFPCSCKFSFLNSNALPYTFLLAWIHTQKRLELINLNLSLEQLELNALVWERR